MARHTVYTTGMFNKTGGVAPRITYPVRFLVDDQASHTLGYEIFFTGTTAGRQRLTPVYVASELVQKFEVDIVDAYQLRTDLLQIYRSLRQFTGRRIFPPAITGQPHVIAARYPSLDSIGDTSVEFLCVAVELLSHRELSFAHPANKVEEMIRAFCRQCNAKVIATANRR